jgi:hypothetical protein
MVLYFVVDDNMYCDVISDCEKVKGEKSEEKRVVEGMFKAEVGLSGKQFN